LCSSSSYTSIIASISPFESEENELDEIPTAALEEEEEEEEEDRLEVERADDDALTRREYEWDTVLLLNEEDEVVVVFGVIVIRFVDLPFSLGLSMITGERTHNKPKQAREKTTEGKRSKLKRGAQSHTQTSTGKDKQQKE
jgi:hypothetical protein